MRVIDVKDAVRPLAEYVKEIGEGPVAVTGDGRPVAVVMAIEDVDLETMSLSTNPKFIALIERSRARQAKEGGISSEEMRRRLGL